MGLPLRHTELEPRSNPVAGDSEPGVPMPMLPRRPNSASASRSNVATMFSVPW